MATILIADDEPELAEILATEIRFEGHQPTVTGNGTEAWRAFEQQSFDLVLSDVRMPGGDGIELLAQVRKRDRDTPFLFLSGFADFTVREALAAGADRVLQKPLALEALAKQVAFFLQPWTDRWTGPAKHPLARLSTSLNTIGRGGFCVSQVLAEVGYRCELQWNGTTLKGEASVVWQEGVHSGLEFTYLEPNSQRFLEQQFQDTRPLAYIPGE